MEPRRWWSNIGQMSEQQTAPTPEVDDTLLIGLDRAAPGCAIALHVECEAEGHGIDPTDPPLPEGVEPLRHLRG